VAHPLQVVERGGKDLATNRNFGQQAFEKHAKISALMRFRLPFLYPMVTISAAV
jgi:hypothetical protein